MFVLEYVPRLQKFDKKELQDIRDRVYSIRERSIANLNDLLKSFMENITDAGASVYLCKDDNEAFMRISEIIGEEKIVVKSKSNVCREIQLSEKLRQMKIEVIETDCGDFIADLLGIQPTHPIIPVGNVDFDTIKRVINEKLGIQVSTIDDAKNAIRKVVSKKMEEARVGIIGANFLTPTGDIVTVENEGNIGKILRECEKIVVVTSIEKVVPSIEDAIFLAKILPIFGLGNARTSYVNIISSPSSTSDICGVNVKGMYGCAELHVILVDNGRSRALNTEFRDALRCIDCGGCSSICPVVNATDALSGRRIGPIGIIYEYIIGRDVSRKILACSLCGRCSDICPAKIPIRDLLVKIRRELYEKKLLPDKVYHAVENIEKYGNPVGEVREGEEMDLYCC